MAVRPGDRRTSSWAKKAHSHCRYFRIGIDLARHGQVHAGGPPGEEALQVREVHDAALLAGRVLVELQVLPLEAEAGRVPPARPDQRVPYLPVVQEVVARQPEVAGHLRHHAADGEVAEGLARDPGQALGDVHDAAVVGQRHRAVESHAEGVEQARREGVLALRGDVGVAGALVDHRDRRLVHGHADHVAAVVGDAHEHVVGRRQPVIDAGLEEVLVGGLGLGEEVLGGAAAQRAAVGPREEGVEDRPGWPGAA